MNNEENLDIITEFTDMVNNVEDFKKDIDAYCAIMKDMFLKTSSLN